MLGEGARSLGTALPTIMKLPIELKAAVLPTDSRRGTVVAVGEVTVLVLGA